MSDDIRPPQEPVHEPERPGGLLSRVDGHVVLYHDPHSLQAEQYRAFRTNMAALNPSGAPWAVLFTSARKGEGKSTSVANIAACLAEVPGTRVCLLDVDSRSPSLAGLFGVEASQGTTELLKGEATLRDVIRATVIPNLDVIHAGVEPANPAELLGSDGFSNLLAELKRRYTWILLDAPPVNPFTDPCVVAAQCDGSVIVVRLQMTDRELVNASMDSIQNAGGRVLGTFVTGVTAEQDDDEHERYYRKEGGVSGEHKERARVERERRKGEREKLKAERSVLKQRQKRTAEDDEEHPV